MNFRLFLRALALFFVCLVPTLSAWAQDAAAAEARMAQRVSQIDALKVEEKVGENNAGFLEARASLSPAESSLVDQENADRREVYAEIASRTKAGAEAVGQQRAAQIARRSPAGAWLQDARGNWYQK